MTIKRVYHVPEGAHHAIIGRGGKTIRRLTRQYRVRINIPRGGGTGVSIVGQEDNVESCKADIEDIVGFSIGTDPLSKLLITLDKRKHGSLIGRGGSVIRGLEAKSGCNIDIPRRNNDSNKITVVGTADGIQTALNLISEVLGFTPDTEGDVEVETKSSRQVRLDYSQPINEALFFPDRDRTDDDEDEGNSFQRFLHFLRAAEETMDIAVFTLSDNRISNILEDKFLSGIKVRIITDDDTSSNLGSDIEALAKVGIPIKQDKTEAHMHHKFCIIDGKLLINGSFNWTRSAATVNEENVMVTSTEELVQDYQEHFDFMWDDEANFQDYSA